MGEDKDPCLKVEDPGSVRVQCTKYRVGTTQKEKT